MRFPRIFLSFALSLWLVYPVHACPCGCGSSSSVSLYPNESFRLNLGLTNEFAPVFFDETGTAQDSAGSESIHTLKVSAATRLLSSLTWALHAPIKFNRHSDYDSHASLGDPKAELLWTAYDRDYEHPWIPELVLKSGLKYPYSISGLDKSNLSPTEIYGNGFWETSFGADTYFYISEWTLSASYEQILRNNRTTPENVSVHPGMIYKTQLGTAYTFISIGQLGMTLSREDRMRDTISTVVDDATRMIRHELGFSSTLRVGDRKNIGLAYFLPAPFLPQQNAPFYQSIALSYSLTI